MGLPISSLRLGPLRLSPYGACAVVGVIAGMALSGRAARRLGVSPEQAWDAGLFAILSCFVASRLLLVLQDPSAFLHFPVLILGLPSLTIAGIALAGVVTWLYLRRKRWPMLHLLDAFAPCGALLATFLELGHWLEGSEPGMPLVQPQTRPAVALDPLVFYQVALAGVLLSAGLAWWLWSRLGKDRVPGRVAALGLIAGGFAAFLLNWESLPTELFGWWWLEPGQVVDLGAMLAGAVLWTFARDANRLRAQEELG